jgi:hypothetical protein
MSYLDGTALQEHCRQVLLTGCLLELLLSSGYSLSLALKLKLYHVIMDLMGLSVTGAARCVTFGVTVAGHMSSQLVVWRHELSCNWAACLGRLTFK